jgi:hypothetical protein
MKERVKSRDKKPNVECQRRTHFHGKIHFRIGEKATSVNIMAFRESYVPRTMSKVLVHGESSRDPVFREVVERAVEGISDENLVPVYAGDPVFVAAKGAAELERRALAGREWEKGFGEL